MNLKVYRYREGMAAPRYDTFELAPSPGMTVLEALFLSRNNSMIHSHFIIPAVEQSVAPVRC